MKKLVVIFFALLYTVSTTGVVGSNFYCHGELKSSDLFPAEKADDCCPEESDLSCRTAIDDECCNIKTFTVKVADQHAPSTRLVFNGDDLIKLLPALPAPLFTFDYIDIPALYIISSSPPLARKQPVYLDNCVFRI